MSISIPNTHIHHSRPADLTPLPPPIPIRISPPHHPPILKKNEKEKRKKQKKESNLRPLLHLIQQNLQEIEPAEVRAHEGSLSETGPGGVGGIEQGVEREG